MSRSIPPCGLLLFVACSVAHPQGEAPAVPASPSVSVASAQAVFSLPLPALTDSVTCLLWVISWDQESPPRMTMGDFGLWVGDTLTDSLRLPVTDRLRNLTHNYYRLESAGSIVAMVSQPEPAMQVQILATTLQLILGPSTALNELLAWHPDSLRLDRSRDDLTGPATVWLRPAYRP
jgi:hypothetical protein